MKSILTQAFLLSIAMSLLTACSKKNLSPRGNMSSRIDNVAWSTDSTEAGYRGDNIELFVISSYHTASINDPSSRILWQLSYTPLAGHTYDIGILAPLSVIYSTGNVNHYGALGQITITSISASNVQGSFEFTTADSIHVTNGSFNIPVTPDPAL